MALSLLLAAAAAAVAPPGTCQAALGPLFDGPRVSGLPNQVNGSSLPNARALIALRAARGDDLLIVNGGNLAGADLRRARLRNICFIGTDLSDSDWSGAEAMGVGFVGANLEGATLASAELRHVLLRNANLKNVRAERAMLVGGRLDGGWFDGSVEGLRLDGADLSDFRFECGITLDDGCPVYQGGPDISLRGANLAGANLWGSPDLAAARLDRTIVGLADLSALRSARFEGPILVAGGEATAELSAEEYRSLLPHLVAREDLTPDPEAASVERPAAPPDWAAPGRYALFVDGERDFASSIRSHRLYNRLLPVIVGSSSSRVVVRFNPDGSIDAAGEAIGANAHMCSLAADGLRFDRATGWYSGPQEPAEGEPPNWRGRPMAVLMLSGDSAFVNVGAGLFGPEDGRDPRFSDYASCGARAGFSRMVRVPVSEDEARRLFETLGETGL
jgi:uncharacterized protein YjbI with pentapeptide repeats